MTGLAGKIENEIHVANQKSQAMLVSHVGNIDPYAIFNSINVEKIAAEVFVEAIDKQDVAVPSLGWLELRVA